MKSKQEKWTGAKLYRHIEDEFPYIIDFIRKQFVTTDVNKIPDLNVVRGIIHVLITPYAENDNDIMNFFNVPINHDRRWNMVYRKAYDWIKEHEAEIQLKVL